MDNQSQHTEAPHLSDKPPRRTGRLPRWLRWVLRLVALFILLPVAFFQIPWVQSKAAQRLTEYLSQELQTKVSIERVYLGIFNKIIVDEFYIADLHGDTLMYAGELKVNHSGLFMIPFRRFRVETLTLTDADIHIDRLPGESENNIQFLLDYFANPDSVKTQTPRKPFHLNLRHLYLHNIHFFRLDEVKGETFDVFLTSAEAHFDLFDLNKKRIDIASLAIAQPKVKIRSYPGSPLPDNLAPAKPNNKKVPTVNSQVPNPQAPAPDTSKLVITIGEFDLAGGVFSIHNKRKEPTRLTPPEVLNFNYLDVFDLDVQINDFTFSELEFSGEIKKVAARESSGFVLENLSVKQASLSCEGMKLLGMELRTPQTTLGDTLIFKYKTYYDWEDFTNEVRMEGRFHNASVALQDIMTFAPALRNNPFFRENADQVVQLDGTLKGTVNGLDGRNLSLDVGEGLHLEGSFSTRNLAVPDEQYLHLNLDRLQTDVATLRKLIPGIKAPALDRLGHLDFSGKFDGFFVDFVADGRLRTDLGSATMFMNLKLREGKEKARYSGDLYLENFDLGAFSGSPDLGKITLDSHVKQGVGLTQNSANAKLEGVIDSMVFRGYKYRNVTVNGELAKQLFNGDLKIEDQNVSLTFGGKVNFKEVVPQFDFVADVQRLSLLPLNLSKKDLQFRGKVAMLGRGKTLDDIVGTVAVQDFWFVKNRRDTLEIDTATLISSLETNGEKHFQFTSNLGDVDLQGKFLVEKIPNQFLNYLTLNFPRFSKKIGIKPPAPGKVGATADTARFTYWVKLKDLQGLPAFINEKLSGFDKAELTGSFDGYKNELVAEVTIPAWKWQKIGFGDVYFKTDLEGNEGSLLVGVMKTEFSEEQSLAPILVNSRVFGDSLEFLLISSNFYKVLDNLNINGLVTLDSTDAWRLSFLPSDLVLLNQTWDIDTANFIRIGEGTVETQNFVLSHREQQIVLRAMRGEGLELQVKNFPLDSIQQVRSVKQLKIGGVADLQAKIKDVFRFQGLTALLRIKDLKINDDDYGVLRLDAAAPSLQETVSASFSIDHDTMEMVANGYFNPPGFILQEGAPDRKWVKNQPLYFDFDLSFTNYPAKILNYFVADVSNVQGSASAENVKVTGLPSKPEISGDVSVRDVSFKLNALQVAYRIPEATVKLTNRLFDASGGMVFDRFGNRAIVTGGITHNHLKNFGLDVTIATEFNRPFLGLETTAKNNPIFYGTAIGTGYVRFTGTFQQPSLYVNARTMRGTHMYLPLTSSAPTKDVRFITFSEATKKEESGNGNPPLLPSELRGLNMDYDLEITPDAEMDVIFDKAWGDVLRGAGSGRLLVHMDRYGSFTMDGTFTVARGDYLFTLMNIGFNKAFVVEPGGTVTWSGSPYDANIDITATYKDLYTSVYNFIAEYTELLPEDVQNLARSSTPVNLKMNLKGSLLKPDIEFDVEFPNLSSELRSLAENKLRTIRQDPNEMSRQVFGLLVLGQFLPSGYTFQAGNVGINTISEMLSNQFSIYLTGLVSDLFAGNSIIQNIDFDVSYNRYSSGSVDDPAAFTGNELITRLRVSLGDRVSVLVGGNFDVGGGTNIYSDNRALVANEFMIEYVLTKDRRLKIKVYNRGEPDITGRRNETGAGISFRKEFDSLDELFEFGKKKNKKKN